MFNNEDLKTMDPVAWAKSQNAERNAQAKAEGWKFWTLAPEDAKWYAKMGYKTAYDYVLATTKSHLSDLFKETNGFRPRGVYDWENMDLEACEAEIDTLYKKREAEKKLTERQEARYAEAYAEATKGDALTHNPFSILLEES